MDWSSFSTSLGFYFVIGLLVGIVLGILAEFLAIRIVSRVLREKTLVAVAEKSSLPEAKAVVESVKPAVVAQSSKPSVVQDVKPYKFGQRFWYFVKGREKPFPSLREAVMTFPTEAAKCNLNRLDYRELSQFLQDNIRREPIVKEK